MIPFRVKWTWQTIVAGNSTALKRELNNPGDFWKILALKFIPNLSKKPAKLVLKDGKHIYIHQLMDLFIFQEIFLDQCYDDKTLSKDPVIIDIGANCGMFAIRMKQLYPEATIHCFEPFKENFERLLANVSQFSGVTCYEKGVAGVSRHHLLFIHGVNPGAHSIYEEVVPKHVSSVDVELVGINELHTLTGVTKADLLKMDCEGAEVEIVEALTAHTASMYPKIVLEWLLSPEKIVSHLEKTGYSVTKNDPLIHAILN